MDRTHCYLVACALIGVVLAFLASRVYKAIWGPLSHLPGPFVSRWTRLRLKYEVLRANRVHYVQKMHERYGNIVRLSPTEVSVADVDAMKTIYRVGGSYVKSPWYKIFTGFGRYANMFAITDPKLHAHIRKGQSYHFSERWVKNLEPFMARNVQKAVQRMDEDVRRDGWTDIFKWFTFMATDVIGEAAFGDSFRMLETGKKNQYSTDLENVARYGTVRGEFPTLVYLLSFIPVGVAKQLGQAVSRLEGYGRQSLQRYERLRNADPENVKPTLLTKLYDAIDQGTYAKEQLDQDARGNVIAGTDTTAIVATYAVWLLAAHPEIEYEVIRAVSSLPSEFVDEDLREVKILNNVIQETLRLRGAVGSAMPRIVPAGGAELAGYFVPGGATVAAQPWTMHRKPDIWVRPDAFEPSRWDEPTKEMKDCFFAFGGGSRICIGMHFAQLELRHALARFYRTFDVGVRPYYGEGFEHSEMEPASLFLMPPKGKRCLVTPRKTMSGGKA